MLNVPMASDTNPNSLGRYQAALATLLEQGQRFIGSNADLASAEELLGWKRRLDLVCGQLQHHFKLPMRSMVIEQLERHLDDFPDVNALMILRMNLAGASFDQFAAEVGLSGNTIRRVEAGAPCQMKTARNIAVRFGLLVPELCESDHIGRDQFSIRSVAGLHSRLTDDDYRMT